MITKVHGLKQLNSHIQVSYFGKGIKITCKSIFRIYLPQIVKYVLLICRCKKKNIQLLLVET